MGKVRNSRKRYGKYMSRWEKVWKSMGTVRNCRKRYGTGMEKVGKRYVEERLEIVGKGMEKV